MGIDIKIKARIVAFDEAYEMAFAVAQKIISAGYHPDIILAIARGGFPPARFLADFLKEKNMTSLQLEHYNAGAQKSAEVKILDQVGHDLSGKKVLIADDVNDTGETLLKALEHVNNFQPADIRTAVLHEKQNTEYNTDFVGDYLQEWQWLIYQWAAVEDVQEFLAKAEHKFNNKQEAERYLLETYELEVAEKIMDKVWLLLQ